MTNFTVTCKDESKLPATGKIVEFYRTLKEQGSRTDLRNTLIVTRGKHVIIPTDVMFNVYRVMTFKHIGMVYPHADMGVTPVSIRDGVVTIDAWPMEDFLDRAVIENSFMININKDAHMDASLEKEPTYQYYYESSGDLGERYRISFVNEQQHQMLRYQETSDWYKAVMASIDRIVLGSESRKVKVTLLNQTSHNLEANYPTVLLVDGEPICCHVKDGKLIEGDFIDSLASMNGLSFFVELLPMEKVDTKPEVTVPKREWIPQMNQFVRIEGDDELYTIVDYDMYRNLFILRKADSARHERDMRLGGVSMDSRRGRHLHDEHSPCVTVKGGRLRPYTLSY